MLGSYFLNERLGTLGKLGCAMCLLGSVVIVLHAPPDQPVETIDEILQYAMSIGVYCICQNYLDPRANTIYFIRFLTLLRSRRNFLNSHDLPRCSCPWKEEPSYIHIHLLHSWLRLCHVYQSLWNCG